MDIKKIEKIESPEKSSVNNNSIGVNPNSNSKFANGEGLFLGISPEVLKALKGSRIDISLRPENSKGNILSVFKKYFLTIWNFLKS